MKTDPWQPLISTPALLADNHTSLLPPRFITIAWPFLNKHRREQLTFVARGIIAFLRYITGACLLKKAAISHGFSLADICANGPLRGRHSQRCRSAEMAVLKPAKFEAILNRRTAARQPRPTPGYSHR